MTIYDLTVAMHSVPRFKHDRTDGPRQFDNLEQHIFLMASSFFISETEIIHFDSHKYVNTNNCTAFKKIYC